jgi:hypothetical protein
MKLNESIVKDTALTWFGELSYAIGHGLLITPCELAAERGVPPFSADKVQKIE